MDGVGQDLPAGWRARRAPADSRTRRSRAVLLDQLRSSTNLATRSAAGVFPHLLDFATWPTAFWVFQDQASRLFVFATHYLIAGAFWILSVVGIVGLLRRRRWDVVLLGLGLSAGAVLTGRVAALRLWGL